ncbi:MAG: hypothetical protein KAX38_00380, partial [Candidatus Krumholzibacteria bacterium]|nr:hypothetical protein [Candidatus Krumholzibacteria bacterium]
MSKFTHTVVLAALLIFCSDPCSGSHGKYYLKADLGYSLPSLPNLSSELEHQGIDGPQPGCCLSVALGRSFSEMNWSVEGYFSLSFYPEFDYLNDYEKFEGKLSHYLYAVILKRRILPGNRSISPSIGAGLGYGITNLITGGGKIGAFEALAVIQVEALLNDNIGLIIEGSYSSAFKKGRFEKPFLENIESDVVQDSEGKPIEDRFS